MDSWNNENDNEGIMESERHVCKKRRTSTSVQPNAPKPRICTPGPFAPLNEGPSTSTASRILATLNLDGTFFPQGLYPGSIVEIKGPENSGKTFMMTYFIANFLRHHHWKKVVLIDTSHQFSMNNLISMLCTNQPFCSPKLETASVRPPSEIINATPVLHQYLDRLIIFECTSVEQFLMTVASGNASALKKTIKNHQDISLIAIDTIDCYSFTEATDRNDKIDILGELKAICDKIPVIATTIHIPKTHTSGFQPQPEDDVSWYSNILIDRTHFTHFYTIVPESSSAVGIKSTKDQQYKYEARAYLRSKHSSALAGEIHRVKFSIFSDMLWTL